MASTTPALPPTPVALSFTLIENIVNGGNSPSPQQITTIGYLVVDGSGAALVGELAFADDGAPQLITHPEQQIWLGTEAASMLKSGLQGTGVLRYASVVARGQLAGPGMFGPNERYHYQLRNVQLEPLAAQETSIDDLISHTANYENRLVRIVGGLLARDTSALLVEQLGAGGVPAPSARQIKLRAPLHDQALLKRLNPASNGTIRFGQIQVEGIWRGGILLPLSMQLVT